MAAYTPIFLTLSAKHNGTGSLCKDKGLTNLEIEYRALFLRRIENWPFVLWDGMKKVLFGEQMFFLLLSPSFFSCSLVKPKQII